VIDAGGLSELQFVILAGGLGTRMRAVTGDLPKALIPVAGRPFAHHQLALLASQGVRRVVYCIGHEGARLRAFVRDGSPWGLHVSYVDEGAELLGTGGALRAALDAGALDEEVAVLYGDSYLPAPFGPIVAAFQDSGSPALMTVLRNEDRWDASNAVFRDGRVVLYDKSVRSPEMAWIDYGLTILRTELLSERVMPRAIADLADLMHDLSREGLLAGYQVEGRFHEVGSPEGLAELEGYLARTP
jgi:NDP-sugar pyrophosphorylase family protein